MASKFEDKIKEVQAKHPTLTQFGFGGEGEIRLDAVNLCAEWLLKHDGLDRRKTINTASSSYGLKHVVERVMGQYVANGEFICAALVLGYKMKKLKDNPNAYFNIRKLKDNEYHAIR